MMTDNENLISNEENVDEASKKRRTRIAKKEITPDHVYTVNGTAGENLDTPKRKRGRPRKADKLAEEQRLAEAAKLLTPMMDFPEDESLTSDAIQTDEGVAQNSLPEDLTDGETHVDDVITMENESVADDTSSELPSEAHKRRRMHKTKEEIIAAAAAKAAALAAANQMRAEQESRETREQTSFAGANPEATGVPEAVYTEGDTEGSMSTEQLEQLQQHFARQNDAANDDNHVWEADPGDGTDFIIVQDLPVEDNAAIPYYDMFDAPQNVSQNVSTGYYEPEPVQDNDAFTFTDIVSAIGLLEIMPDGYGFLRSSDYNYLASPDDVHLTQQQIKQYSLKTGDVVECMVRPPRAGEKYFTMSNIVSVDGRNPDDIRDRISFENLTPLFPDEKFNLCGDTSTTTTSTRIVDLFSPIGKGQRSLIVAQPKTGKTILMKDIANAIAANHPEAYIMMLLIDERPEEVTDMERTVNAEVIASTFDEPADRHVKIAGLVLEKAKRMVECGHDVVIFLDSITRLARAYNTVAPASGKVLTGGVDANALQKPKRFFGAARNIEHGGSLTIIATALTDTGSKMDEVIFEEFKGTGNSELQLDRQLANKRIFPAVNLVASSTRRDDLLLDETTINRMWILRKHIADMNTVEAMNEIKGLITSTRNHQEFLMGMNK